MNEWGVAMCFSEGIGCYGVFQGTNGVFKCISLNDWGISVYLSVGLGYTLAHETRKGAGHSRCHV